MDINTSTSAVPVKTSSLQPMNQNKLGLERNKLRLCVFQVKENLVETPATLQAGIRPDVSPNNAMF